jgi:hypothetical protein
MPESGRRLTIAFRQRPRFADKVTNMKTPDALAAFSIMERAELYYAAHPRTPSAVRRPKIFNRSNTWVALLGPNVQQGFAGFGSSVEAALRAFDALYLKSLQPPPEAPQIRSWQR